MNNYSFYPSVISLKQVINFPSVYVSVSVFTLSFYVWITLLPEPMSFVILCVFMFIFLYNTYSMDHTPSRACHMSYCVSVCLYPLFIYIQCGSYSFQSLCHMSYCVSVCRLCLSFFIIHTVWITLLPEPMSHVILCVCLSVWLYPLFIYIQCGSYSFQSLSHVILCVCLSVCLYPLFIYIQCGSYSFQSLSHVILCVCLSVCLYPLFIYIQYGSYSSQSLCHMSSSSFG